MARNQSEKSGIIAHKTVTPANWQVPAHAFLFRQGDDIWVMAHTASGAHYKDAFIGKRYRSLAQAQALYDALLVDFWFSELPGEMSPSYVGNERLMPPGWLESKARKQCAAQRERL